ncbi:hypothetical protein TIFTF001_029552 [Ficus carica]|uniref:Floricaula/leafy-like transcription factor n=1 Tax=Ficus carica TaxID=3494 RepID=A0AA88DRX9_FICCA|nr:hypothetical protein TIFTF001_029552 [Ficus carica]
MDPDAFTASLFKWDPRGCGSSMVNPPPPPPPPAAAVSAPAAMMRCGGWGEQLGGLEELFQAYGIRYYTAAKIAELGFTARTLVNMTDEELDDMMTSLSHIFRWDLLVGESGGGGGGGGEGGERRKKQQQQQQQRRRSSKSGAHIRRNMVMLEINKNNASNSNNMILDENDVVGDQDDGDEDDESNYHIGANNNNNNNNSNNMTSSKQRMAIGCGERQREHPFIVTEPGEVARGKKNGLDYLFHLYEQCREFLLQVQAIAKERGEKCPTKLDNSTGLVGVGLIHKINKKKTESIE